MGIISMTKSRNWKDSIGKRNHGLLDFYGIKIIALVRHLMVSLATGIIYIQLILAIPFVQLFPLEILSTTLHSATYGLTVDSIKMSYIQVLLKRQVLVVSIINFTPISVMPSQISTM